MIRGEIFNIVQRHPILFFKVVVIIVDGFHEDGWGRMWYNRRLLDGIRYSVILDFMLAARRHA
jgi:hypothetical protein